MELLKLGEKIIHYEMCPNKQSKRIKVTVNKDKVKVSFPPGIEIKIVKEFVESKKHWIFKTLETVKFQQAEIPVRNYLAGEEYLFQGNKYILKPEIVEGNSPFLEVKEGEIWVRIPNNIPQEKWSQVIKEELHRWYKDQAKRIFQEKAERFSKIMGLKYNRMMVKNQKTRWGSCSSKGNINLNWRVIMAPDEVSDYLIIHELVHLKYLNHSPDFWNLVKTYQPDYLKWRSWLRENGKILVV